MCQALSTFAIQKSREASVDFVELKPVLSQIFVNLLSNFVVRKKSEGGNQITKAPAIS